MILYYDVCCRYLGQVLCPCLHIHSPPPLPRLLTPLRPSSAHSIGHRCVPSCHQGDAQRNATHLWPLSSPRHLQEAGLRERRGQNFPMIHLASGSTYIAVRMYVVLVILRNLPCSLLFPQTRLVRSSRTRGRPVVSPAPAFSLPGPPDLLRRGAPSGVFSLPSLLNAL